MKSTRSRVLSAFVAVAAAVTIPMTYAGTASADTGRTHGNWVVMGGAKYASMQACLDDAAEWAQQLGYSQVRCIGPGGSGNYTIEGRI
ncbi:MULTISPECIES: hypothetical protein [unclassified Streptomyces]|uniref:Secreted protein n=1 Tax=Streptomyces evansiae TaxID=3075535 RepID=A0ABD5E5V6_9ACTN|nr:MULTISPECIES: hypothetical protein [unclassified Streptomyces]ASY32911.1 hypothetical protein CAC01_09610 [Streptomyces sp. CLI2509]EGJ74901.1 hypothetical protein STTU_2112 [Streptomyces sp. Tu6071]MDT0416592.1 hypothetical protein [Streptomyces sp. DSM 41982]MDT0423735.1 hypothetical protein [Streptomyces sp. DSM 41859]WEH29661.1 hypothetical protein P0D76_21360 [Streptomyces sp. AM 3-1-1]